MTRASLTTVSLPVGHDLVVMEMDGDGDLTAQNFCLLNPPEARPVGLVSHSLTQFGHAADAKRVGGKGRDAVGTCCLYAHR